MENKLHKKTEEIVGTADVSQSATSKPAQPINSSELKSPIEAIVSNSTETGRKSRNNNRKKQGTETASATTTANNASATAAVTISAPVLATNDVVSNTPTLKPDTSVPTNGTDVVDNGNKNEQKRPKKNKRNKQVAETATTDAATTDAATTAITSTATATTVAVTGSLPRPSTGAVVSNNPAPKPETLAPTSGSDVVDNGNGNGNGNKNEQKRRKKNKRNKQVAETAITAISSTATASTAISSTATATTAITSTAAASVKPSLPINNPTPKPETSAPTSGTDVVGNGNNNNSKQKRRKNNVNKENTQPSHVNNGSEVSKK